MAKYEDYVKQTIEEEIDEAATESVERQAASDIPERFKGKSAEEIARAYAELERMTGNQANELGELRKIRDRFLELQTKPSEPAKPAKEPPKPVTVDDLYENADDSIRRVVREEAQSRIEELERKLAEAEQRSMLATARAEFEKKHPDWQDKLKDPAFIEWIKASPYRVRTAQVADQGDFDAADELFSTYAEINGAKKRTPQEKKAAVRSAALESSGGSAPAPVEKYSRQKLTEVRIRARQGDLEAERWLAAHGDEILRAYSEGRIVN